MADIDHFSETTVPPVSRTTPLTYRSSGKNFRHRLDVFFNKTPQEDLLAFIEDSITPNEEGASEGSFPVTTEGAEPIFIALKTVVDVLTQG